MIRLQRFCTSAFSLLGGSLTVTHSKHPTRFKPLAHIKMDEYMDKKLYRSEIIIKIGLAMLIVKSYSALSSL